MGGREWWGGFPGEHPGAWPDPREDSHWLQKPPCWKPPLCALMRLLVRWTSSGSYHSVLRRTRWRTGAGQGAPGEEPSTSSAFWPPFSALGFSCSANPLERGNVSPFRKPTVPPRKAALSGSGSVSRHEEEPPPDGAPGHSSLRDALATITNLDSSALNAPGLWATAVFVTSNSSFFRGTSLSLSNAALE